MNVLEKEHIRFVQGIDSSSGKTKTWIIENTHTGETIGKIKWAGNFRKYAFFPLSDTVYDNFCLADIAYFLVLKTEQHKEARQ